MQIRSSWKLLAIALLGIVLHFSSAEAALFDNSTGVRWPSAPAPNHPGQTHTPIRVCAVDGDSFKKIDDLEDALEDSWEKESRIDFHDFRLCSDLTQAEQDEAVGWRYAFKDIQKSRVGYDDCKGRVTSTNFCIQSGVPRSYVSACTEEKNYEKCAKQYAIHEFGHVIGFDHGFDRWDRPCGCELTSETLFGTPYLYSPDLGDFGGYDDKSIMTYGEDCIAGDSDSVRFGGSNLSAGDIAAVRLIYLAPLSLAEVKEEEPAPVAASTPIEAATQLPRGGSKINPEACPEASLLQGDNSDEITLWECRRANSAEHRDPSYCVDDECIPDLIDPHHPKFHSGYPVDALGADDLLEQADAGLLGETTDFEIACGKDEVTQQFRIKAAGYIKVRLKTDGKCSMKETWWYRSHWTVTCWVYWSTDDSTSYRCQNWNTEWGDAHHAWFEGEADKEKLLLADAVVAESGASDVIQAPAYCHEGLCIPDSENPHHPKFNLRYPVVAQSEQSKADGGLLGEEEFEGYFWRVGQPKAADTRWRKSPDYSISPAGAIEAKLKCPRSCDVRQTEWNRSHWTVTCWVTWSTSEYTNYRCQNWNTVWGDKHDAWFDVSCTPCAKQP